MSPSGRPLADFGQRLLAYVVDYAIIGVVSIAIWLPLYLWWFVGYLLPRMELASQPDAAPGAELPMDEFFATVFLPMIGIIALVILIMVLITYVYFVEMMFRTGQTIGKRVVKIRIEPLDPGVTLTRGAATTRWLVQWMVAMFVPFFSYLDGFWQLWDKPFRQCLHDKVPRTVVVKIPG